jgi:hypothetical protein
MIASLLVAIVWLASPAVAFDALPPEVEQAFYDGAHSYFDCIDCHADTITSTIARTRIPTVCGECHPKARTHYQQSVHWSNGKAETVCIDCHGVHGILPVTQPGSKAFRSLVCGDCHIGPMEHFVTGPHHAAFEESGALACASCHSNHAVLRPTVAVVEPACEACHTTPSSAFAFGQSVKDQLDGLREALDRVDTSIRNAEGQGLDTRRAAGFYVSAQAAYTQTRLVWHGLDGDAITKTSTAALDETRRALEEIVHQGQTLDHRKKWLVALWCFILLSVLLLALKKRALDQSKPPTG